MAVLTWLRDLADNGALMTSVCTGALVWADSGLLDGQAATTHWADLEELAGLGRDIEVRADERFVDAGAVITAAGVSAGIDMALHLIARLHSPSGQGMCSVTSNTTPSRPSDPAAPRSIEDVASSGCALWATS